MSQRVVTSTLNTNIPGAYPSITVQSQPVGLGNTGNIAIVGEADGGADFTAEVLKNNVYSPDQLSKVQQKYLSGQIVDAMSALAAPSNDPGIVGSANSVYILKTNISAQAQGTLASYGTLKDLNFGINGNKYSYQVTQIASEVAPTVQGSTITAFGAALNGASFSVYKNGGGASVVTLGSNSSSHSNIANLVTELNTLLPSGIVASAGTATNSLALTITPDVNANSAGSGKSFELADSTPGDLAALGLTAGIVVSSQEPGIEVAINRSDINLSETIDVSADVAMTVGYQGSAATMTINQATSTLTTTVTGGSGANLSIDISQYNTIAQLAQFINSQTGYSASAPALAQQLPTSALDSVSAIGINTAQASNQPGRVKDALFSFEQALATSVAVSFSATATAGLPAVMANPSYLTGGTRGATSAATILNAIQALAGLNIQIIVPLFSQDSSADITAGITDPSSSYTIAAVNAAVKNHCIEYSTPKLKRNRIAILSFNGIYSLAKQAAQGLANYRCSLAMQQAVQENSSGIITTFQPWFSACVAAGMQTGGFYKSITNKLANVISFVDPVGFDSGDPGDVEDALSAGLLFMTSSNAGNSWVCDQTTYGLDTNFVYNSIQAVYCSDIIAIDMASSFQSQFVGQSLADVDASAALSYLAQKMDGYKKLKLIASSSDAPLGYKNAKISITAPEMDVAVEIKLATAIYFIPININVSQISQSAG